MRYIVIALTLLIVSSCGIFKRTNKDIHVVEHKEVVLKDSTSETVIYGEVKDKGIIETETTTTTERKKPGVKAKAKGELEHGVNILTDSIGREFIAIFDTLSKVVEVSIVLPDEVETVTKHEKKSEKKDEEKKEVIKQAATVREEKAIRSKESVKKTESKPDYTWILYIVFAGVVVFVLIKRKVI